MRCGARAAEIHHRQPRRTGGHRLCNLVSLCSADHRWAHANPAAAREQGFIVSIHGDPALVPISTYSGPVYLTDAGGYETALTTG